MTTEEKIGKVKTNIVLTNSFFAMILLKLKYEEDKNCPTMWTDGLTIGYNPDFVNSINVDELKGVLLHEGYHILLLHHLREGNRNHIVWNMAGDYAINYLLNESGIKLPEGHLLNYDFANMETEKIYEKLIKNAKQIVIIENDENFKGNIGEVRHPKHEDGSPYSADEIKQLEAETKVKIQQAYQIAKNKGSLPRGIERIIKDILTPVVNWKNVLQEFVTHMTKNDYTWTKPNRRFLPDFYLPSTEKPELGELVIAIDTSGSLTDKELAEIGAEIRSIMATFTTHLTVIYCDAAVNRVDEFDSGEDINLKYVGGGGTDYIPVFKEIEKRGIEPVSLLYFTDGYCDSFPKNIPDYQTLWILTEENPYFKNNFGEKVVMRSKK